MQAIILAGGKGTRLGDLTLEIPKPMVKVGDKPIIEHQIRLLESYGVKKIKLVVNHLKEPLINYLGDGSELNVDISYFEEKEPLGTSGAFPLFENELEDVFLVVYGDVMFDMDIKRLLDFHQKNKADATLVIHPNDHPHDSDLVEICSENQITSFHSKPHKKGIYLKNLVNAGVYVFNKQTIRHLPGPVKNDFGKDIFPDWIHKLKVFGYNTPEYLKDMGTLDRLTKVTDDLNSGKIRRKNLANKQKAIFLDRDGVLNEDRHLIHKPEDLVLYPSTSDAIKKINNSDYLAVVATNQSVVARNLCSIDELEYIHKKLDSELGADGAKLDQLYYCPYHPDKGYPEENPDYKKEHPWRKPSPGMLLQGAEDFNINLAQSFMIGDRESDILAGKRAGCTTIALKTGHGYHGAKTQPDYIFNDLTEAIDFVVDDPLLESCSAIEKKLNGDAEKTQVILIGGNAQAGKSTLSKRLSIHLNKIGISNKILSLDNFLLPKKGREKNQSVFDRFQSHLHFDQIEKLLKGEKINLTTYHKDPSLKSEDTLFELSQEKALIVEGVVALADERLRQMAAIKVFADQTFDLYKQRFYHLYEWKKFTPKQIDNLFASRVIDEFRPIKETKAFADLIINTI
ncbi:MAG: HAD-IIIA family hydrolase [Cyclobacteriaceae bacterium]